ncbi:MAG TPA: Lpp/OprI family alanine-zipper lipoprotein [Rhizomicrobium sp.]|nr:Lpp/OprI family alanine-zipper lipoprotein [Rhizomicrobium sp.]
MKPLLLLAVGIALMLGGCATRESVEQAQATANGAESHAVDARTRADAAQSRADAAQARADQANATGGSALTLAQTDAQRADALEAQLKAANAKISYLQRNVVYKKVKHVKHRKRTALRHTAPTTTTNPDKSGS